jgi:hypothetical protein
MTAAGERGLACQMRIEDGSIPHLRRFPSKMSEAIQPALEPLLEEQPAPVLNLRWDEETRLWHSELATSNELSPELRELFENSGYGCLAAETNSGIVHVCHAPDWDIEGFVDKPVRYQWQLIKMPTAPLIRLDVVIADRPENPFKFESFLNVAKEDQSQVLADLGDQGRLQQPGPHPISHTGPYPFPYSAKRSNNCRASGLFASSSEYSSPYSYTGRILIRTVFLHGPYSLTTRL